MDRLKVPIEARFAPEIFRSCIIGAVGIFVCCFADKVLSVYYPCQYQQSQADRIFGEVMILFISIVAGLIFMLGCTLCLRVLSTGVELRFLLFRISWCWEDFKHAETGRCQIYFPLLPPWKRYINCAYFEPVAAEKIWGILMEQVPPPDKWHGPLVIRAEPSLKLTFLDEGVNIRHFRKRYFSWVDLKRAVIFQSAHSKRGFIKIHLVFGERTYRISKVPTLRKRNQGAADYDVVAFLKDHVPQEKLVFCAHSGPASSIEEYEERKKVVAKKKLVSALMIALLGTYFFYSCYKILRALILDGDLLRGYFGVWAVVMVIYLSGLLMMFCLPLILWRMCRNEEKQLDQSRDFLMRNENK